MTRALHIPEVAAAQAAALNAAPFVHVANALSRAERDAIFHARFDDAALLVKARADIAAIKAVIERRFPQEAQRQNALCEARNSRKMGLQRFEPLPFPALAREIAA